MFLWIVILVAACCLNTHMCHTRICSDDIYLVALNKFGCKATAEKYIFALLYALKYILKT